MYQSQGLDNQTEPQLAIKKFHIKRTVGVLAIISFVLVLFLPFDKSSSDVEADKNAIDQFILNSIVNDATDFTESDDSVVTQFLDSNNIDSPLSTEKFRVEINTVLFDSNQ